MPNNETMLQYFEWYLPADSSLWNRAAKDAPHLGRLGFSHIWLPPAYKGSQGQNDVGYGVYDLYDLGEFDQKNSIPVKYGTKEEYIEAIKNLKLNNIKVIADIVFNHKLGADESEEVFALKSDPNDRNITIGEPQKITAWTKYNFPGRNNTYSDFKWNWTHFQGVDWDAATSTSAIYKFYGKDWDQSVDTENGNFDYLMGADIDLNNLHVIKELNTWGKWYLDTTNIDGFRLDAVKHIRSDFFPGWISGLEEYSDKKLFTVGEYWSLDLEKLEHYLENTNYTLSLFDVPLHYNFYLASISNGNFDMGGIFNNTLVKSHPNNAVTFVDNHDTQIGQALESWILDWFKPLAYSLILLRNDTGIPCVFYGDYYGIPEKNADSKSNILDILLKVRKYFAYGETHDYFDHRNIIGWTMEGDYEHPDSGLAVVMSDKDGGCKMMNVGKHLANTVLYDCTGNLSETVYVDNEGNGIFYCNPGSVSVWIKQGQSVN